MINRILKQLGKWLYPSDIFIRAEQYLVNPYSSIHLHSVSYYTCVAIMHTVGIHWCCCLPLRFYRKLYNITNDCSFNGKCIKDITGNSHKVLYETRLMCLALAHTLYNDPEFTL